MINSSDRLMLHVQTVPSSYLCQAIHHVHDDPEASNDILDGCCEITAIGGRTLLNEI